MRSILTIVVALAFVSSAQAVIQIFFTNSSQPYGLTNPSLAFEPTQAYPPAPAIDSTYYQAAAFPPISAWGEVPEIDVDAGEFAYIWARFSNEPTNVKIQGIHLGLSLMPTQIAYYIMNDVDGLSGKRRWDGAYTTGAPEFRLNPQIMAAVPAGGLRNADSLTESWNLYDSTTRTALLAAVRCTDRSHAVMRFDALGIVLKPESGVPYAGVGQSGSVRWVPEPTSLAVLLLPVLWRGRPRNG